MAVTEHLLKAEKNLLLANRLRISDHETSREWSIVLCFYSALHIVDGYLGSQGVHAGSHGERKQCMRRRPELCKGRGHFIQTHFRRLQDLSEQVRYDEGYVLQEDSLKEASDKLGRMKSFLVPKIKS